MRYLPSPKEQKDKEKNLPVNIVMVAAQDH